MAKPIHAQASSTEETWLSAITSSINFPTQNPSFLQILFSIYVKGPTDYSCHSNTLLSRATRHTACEMNPEVEQMKDREKVGQKPRAVQQFCMLHCSGARARQLPLPQWIQAAAHRLPTKQFVRPHLSLNQAETRWAEALRQASEGVLGKSLWISFIYAAVGLNSSTSCLFRQTDWADKEKNIEL